MAIHGKKFTEAAKTVEHSKTYHPKAAIGIAKKAAFAKFDETFELHLKMGVVARCPAGQGYSPSS